MKNVKGYKFDHKGYESDILNSNRFALIMEFLSAHILMLAWLFLLIVGLHMLSALAYPPKVLMGIGSKFFHVHQLEFVIPTTIVIYVLYIITLPKVGIDFYGTRRRYSSVFRTTFAVFKMLALVGMLTLAAKAMKK